MEVKDKKNEEKSPLAIAFEKLKKRYNNGKPYIASRRNTIDSSERKTYKSNLDLPRERKKSVSPELSMRINSPTVQNLRILNNTNDFTGYAGLNPNSFDNSDFKVSVKIFYK